MLLEVHVPCLVNKDFQMQAISATKYNVTDVCKIIHSKRESLNNL